MFYVPFALFVHEMITWSCRYAFRWFPAFAVALITPLWVFDRLSAGKRWTCCAGLCCRDNRFADMGYDLEGWVDSSRATEEPRL